MLQMSKLLKLSWICRRLNYHGSAYRAIQKSSPDQDKGHTLMARKMWEMERVLAEIIQTQRQCTLPQWTIGNNAANKINNIKYSIMKKKKERNQVNNIICTATYPLPLIVKFSRKFRIPNRMFLLSELP